MHDVSRNPATPEESARVKRRRNPTTLRNSATISDCSRPKARPNAREESNEGVSWDLKPPYRRRRRWRWVWRWEFSGRWAYPGRWRRSPPSAGTATGTAGLGERVGLHYEEPQSQVRRPQTLHTEYFLQERAVGHHHLDQSAHAEPLWRDKGRSASDHVSAEGVDHLAFSKVG